jgi:hypothetical protein
MADCIPSEHEEQRETVFWFRRTYPKVMIHAIPNGGVRSKAAGARLKAEGVVPGVPDLFVPAWRMWVEMKRQKGGSVSKEQKDCKAYLENVGYTVFICKGADDAKRQISEFASHLMESL